jgi:hypothetical protein
LKVIESRVVMRIFGVRGRIKTEECGSLCGEMHYCYSSPNINVIGGRNTIHAYHVACMW